MEGLSELSTMYPNVKVLHFEVDLRNDRLDFKVANTHNAVTIFIHLVCDVLIPYPRPASVPLEGWCPTGTTLRASSGQSSWYSCFGDRHCNKHYFTDHRAGTLVPTYILQLQLIIRKTCNSWIMWCVGCSRLPKLHPVCRTFYTKICSLKPPPSMVGYLFTGTSWRELLRLPCRKWQGWMPTLRSSSRFR